MADEEEKEGEDGGSVDVPGKTRGAGAREPKEVGRMGLGPRSGVRSEAGWSLGSPSSSPFSWPRVSSSCSSSPGPR
jgi:hypothetical protein